MNISAFIIMTKSRLLLLQFVLVAGVINAQIYPESYNYIISEDDGYNLYDDYDLYIGSEYITTNDTIEENDYDEFKEGSENFSLNFLIESALLNWGQSVATSPFSVLYLVAQLALYTEGPSHEQLLQALNLQDDDQIRSVFTELTDTLNNQSIVKLEIAARTYVSDQYNLSEAFLNDTENVFGAQAQTVDFDDADSAAETINSWVENKTDDLITDLVNPEMFDQNTVVVLVDAIYFQGDWRNKFNSANTKNRNFYINEETTILMPTMYQRNIFNYAENFEYDFQIISLPFEDQNFSFVIILPNNRTGLPLLLSELRNSTILNEAYQSLENQQVDLYLPKLDIETKMDLKEILSNIGITAIFSDNSGLEGILQTPANLTITSGVQKAVLKVNENGAKAAAASALTIGLTAVQTQPEYSLVFRADHPFIYLLDYNGLTLFCGTFEG